MSPIGRFVPRPRLVDWSLAAAVALVVGTGLYGLTVGDPAGAWVVDLHAVGGLALLVLVALKLRRVAGRVRPDRLTGPRLISVLLAALALGALGTGIWWALGGSLAVGPWGPWGLLMVHMILGSLVPLVLVWHLRHRFHSPGDVDLDRRSALSYAAVVGATGLAWRGQEAVDDLFATPGAERRFTGSREHGSDDGNDFPVTSWVADDPDPIDGDAWVLRVRGRVADPGTFGVEDLGMNDDSDDDSATGTERAVLDCTSGWYSEHDWRGLRVGDLLDRAGPDDAAQWVQFRSVTGYRWSLPIEEARDALLATHVDGERLSHAHGYPLRLVAPDRRGFQWVKWVTGVRVTRRREVGEWVAIFVSGFEE
ncbi:molybdopterin-dependent oxidoreductase [Halomicrobium salinisoli]|uniref:molybdopterin-dependent oxidoreductase n=1 Tax=Halomicrobium salinisoli TaxID=2878391 RepID=UPI001CF0D0DA|nr:molybdopterin-dependent oxidoreductase [Halomicrobium salinisoli]